MILVLLMNKLSTRNDTPRMWQHYFQSNDLSIGTLEMNLSSCGCLHGRIDINHYHTKNKSHMHNNMLYINLYYRCSIPKYNYIIMRSMILHIILYYFRYRMRYNQSLQIHHMSNMNYDMSRILKFHYRKNLCHISMNLLLFIY